MESPSVPSSRSAAELPKKQSFVEIVSNPDSIDTEVLENLHLPSTNGGMVSVKISDAAYNCGLDKCRFNLVAKRTVPVGVLPLKAPDLRLRFCKLWPSLADWNLIPMGKFFFVLQFSNAADLQQVWSAGAINLNPGLIRFSKWTPTFSPSVMGSFMGFRS